MATKRTLPLRDFERAINVGNRVRVRFDRRIVEGRLNHIVVRLTPPEQDLWDSPMCAVPYRRCVMSIARELAYHYGVDVLVNRVWRGRRSARTIKIVPRGSAREREHDPVWRESVGIIEAQRLIESIGSPLAHNNPGDWYTVQRRGLEAYLRRLLTVKGR